MIRIYLILGNLILTSIMAMLGALGYALYIEQPSEQRTLVMDNFLYILLIVYPIFLIGFTVYLFIFTRHVTRNEFKDSFKEFKKGPIL